MNTPLSLFADLPGSRLHYEALGEGPLLLLLHSGGGGYTPGEWDEGCRRLARRFRLLRVERRGYGLSSPRDSFSRDFFREECRELELFLQAVNAPPVFDLLATSDGGTIAMHFACAFPGRVRRIVLESTHAWFEPSMAAELLRRQKKFHDKHGRPRPGTFLATMEAWFRDFRDPQWLEWDIRPEIESIRCPTLVIQGDQDPFVDAEHSREIARRIPGARCEILPDARHLCHRTAPKAFYSLVEEFLG